MENNQKTAIQEMDETIKRRNDGKLIEAVKLVNEAIVAEYKRLEDIAKTEEGDPILIEGWNHGRLLLSFNVRFGNSMLNWFIGAIMSYIGILEYVIGVIHDKDLVLCRR